MADSIKISALTASPSAAGSDVTVVVKGGVNYKQSNDQADALTLTKLSAGSGISYDNVTGVISANLSGTYDISISGNSETATKLAASQNIGNVAFDGSAPIVPQTIQTIDYISSTACFLSFVNSSGTQTSGQQQKTSPNFTFNPYSNAINISETSGNGASITLNGSPGSGGIVYRLVRADGATSAFNAYSNGSDIWQVGLRGSSDNYKIYDVQNSIVVFDITAGATPVTKIAGTFNLSSLNVSQAVVTDGSKNLTSIQYTNANTASTLVQRDGSGNFSAGTITATSFNGNATSATTSTTATNATNCATVSTTTNANFFPLFVASSSNGNQAHNLSDKLQFNPSTGVLNVGATQTKNGIGKLTLTGPNTSASGPHIETYTAADAYPLMQFFSFGHDNMCLSFDCFFDNSINQISSSVNSNFCIYKETNDLAFMYNSGIAAGSNMLTTRKTAFFLDTSGNLNLNNWLKINNSTAPGSNPSGGAYVYAESGAVKARGSSGTITTMAPAEPHCPVCDSDFGLEWENKKYGGNLQVCIKCLVQEIGDRPYVRWKKAA